jgi:hypothetical protein
MIISRRKSDSMKLLIAILILVIVLIAGCTQISSIVSCNPDWMLQGQVMGNNPNDVCKAGCFDKYKVKSYKIEEVITYDCSCTCEGYYDIYCITLNNSRRISGSDKNAQQTCNSFCQEKNRTVKNLSVNTILSYKNCYCDVNNCNP